ncbi:Fibropellin-1-like [Oopsacas minuta]|uniref:Delta-like protein n=1 Tax=Oopsacas minuta TaxID=111878 RepID=A0AAV7JJG6_9METZ|nr:Fibropellin-1-like [Oopsacas minuta]
MRIVILLAFVCVLGCVVVSAQSSMYPQGHDVLFYFWTFSVNGRLASGECCDSTENVTVCPMDCDVHFAVCVREHNESSNLCNSNTSSHIQLFGYIHVNAESIEFAEEDNIFGSGLSNPLRYNFSGEWNNHIQTVLIARETDQYLDSYIFTNIDYIDANWIVAAGGNAVMTHYNGKYGNMMVTLGLAVECWEGWYGEYCTKYCVPQDAPGGHYTCSADGEIMCNYNWIGEDCNFQETCLLPCPVSRICHNGSCDECSQGYAGEDCTCIDPHHCDPDGGHCDTPCVNGGNCDNGMCACTVHYTGQTCTEINDVCGTVIMPSDCQVGQGVCSNSLVSSTGFICTCNPGYTGDNCNMNIDDCEDSPCGDNGMCVDEINAYYCVCNAGFEGTNCEVNKDDCLTGSCLHEGVCVDGTNTFTCECPNGTVQPICELATECSRASCSNHGECDISVSMDTVDSTCICDEGYTGELCAEPINHCDPSPCQTGETCIQGINTYVCVCGEEDCETSVSALKTTEAAVISVAMGVVIIILVIIIIVVVFIAVCIARHKKINRQFMVTTEGPPGAFCNPIYAEANLPTYDEADAFHKNPLPGEEPEYETMDAYKDKLGIMYGYGEGVEEGFPTIQDEKKALENLYK